MDSINTDHPTGGFIPIYKKDLNIKKHVVTSGIQPHMVSIADIFNATKTT